MFGLSKKTQDKLVIIAFAGLISASLWQFETNFFAELAQQLHIHELFLWLVFLLININIILFLGTPVEIKNNELFINGFSGVQILASFYSMFVLANNEIASMLEVPLSAYYIFFGFILIIVFLTLTIIFPGIRNQVRGQRKSSRKRNKK